MARLPVVLGANALAEATRRARVTDKSFMVIDVILTKIVRQAVGFS